MPELRQKADKVRKILRTAYPVVKTQLTHKNPYELLVATILSAQCTDRQVNRVTPKLFAAFPSPAHLAGASEGAIAALVRSTGFYRNKSRHLKQCATALMNLHGGEVPRTMTALTALPGVGRKTANVVLGAAFGIPGVVVDTHVARVSRRIGLTREKTPEKIEIDLMAIVPKSAWRDFSLHLVYFGRETCPARKPKCPACPMARLCDYPDKTIGSP
jgi:endonuclease III